jgi:hypothetical protein
VVLVVVAVTLVGVGLSAHSLVHGLSCPSEFVTKMVDAGESKIYMSTRTP